MSIKIIRACTVSNSVGFVEGMLPDLMKKYEVIVLSSPGEGLDEVAAKHGVRTIAVPMERHISLKHDLVSLCHLIRVFRKERPTMVHSMTPKAGLLCMMAAWLTRVPVRVHTFTGLVFPTSTGLKRRILMATDWLTCACTTHIIPEGEGVKNDLLNNGITKKSLKVLGYGNVQGIDMDVFSVESLKGRGYRIPADERRFTFLFVGRIVRDKGINELVEAFKRLYSEHPECRLVLVGRYEDNLDPISQKARADIEAYDDIVAVGPQYGDDLLAWYAASDCFVMPSYREGFPNTVLEAGAMGLPSVVTDINGSREIISLTSDPSPEERGEVCHLPEGQIQMRKNGIIVPPKDAEALYHAMKMMIENQEERERMAGNARRMISSRFEQDFVRKCLYDFYDEILGS